MPNQSENEQLEREMITAVTKYLSLSDPSITRLRALRLVAVTDNGDTPSGERMVYVNAESCAAALLAAAPLNAYGAAEPPAAPGYGAIPFTG